MDSNLRLRAEERVDRKIKFYINLAAYIVINAILFAVNWYFTPGFWWVFFVSFFWGIGVLLSFLKAFLFVDIYDEDYRERKIEEEMQKLRN